MEQYLKQLKKELKIEPKLKEKVLCDIRAELEARMEQGETLEQAVEKLGTPREVAEDFNKSYPDYPVKKKKRTAFLVSASCAVIGFLCLITGFIGRLTCLGSSSIGYIGGADGPTKIYVETSPITALALFGGMTKAGILIFLAALSVLIFLFFARKKQR